MARLFQSQVAAEYAAHLAGRRVIYQELVARSKRQSRQRRAGGQYSVREEHAIDLTRTWMNLPRVYGFTARPEVTEQYPFGLHDYRLATDIARREYWEDAEIGVAAVVSVVRMDYRGRVERLSRTLCAVGLHGVARWFERTGSRDHALLVTDLSALLRRPVNHRWKCERGIWVGAREDILCEGQEQPAHIARSFLSADMLEG